MAGRKPSNRERPEQGPRPPSSIVRGQGRIEIDFDATDQRLEPFDQARIHGLLALGMASHVVSQKAQELAEYWVVSFKAFGACGAHQYDFAARADAIADLVALAEPQGAPHGFRNGGLVALGQGLFDVEAGRHGVLRPKRRMISS